jgi:hypothetical protein
MNVRGNMLLAITISDQTYGTTSFSKDPTSKCCKSIAPRIVDFDNRDQQLKLDPTLAPAGPAEFSKTNVMATTINSFIVPASS